MDVIFITPHKNSALAAMQDASNRIFLPKAKNCSDKNYMDVIFITPPFMFSFLRFYHTIHISQEKKAAVSLNLLFIHLGAAFSAIRLPGPAKGLVPAPQALAAPRPPLHARRSRSSVFCK
ncbi:MAG: hypothetical protein II098_11620 [Treponema sp.]|nr:hypothetical protein [Treponema sp.]